MIVKRFFDILVSVGVLFFLSPLLLIICILVKINMGSPVLFIQERIGKDNKVFKIIKFRTMKDAKDKNGQGLPDFERVTKLGSFLRVTSLDELPELLNVIKGEMSLVGPRPLLKQYLTIYNDKQIRRHDVLPGLTGWAQVNGRNNLTWNEKFELDIWYVENWSLKIDIKIFFMTFYKVFKREGINPKGQASTEYFNGGN